MSVPAPARGRVWSAAPEQLVDGQHEALLGHGLGAGGISFGKVLRSIGQPASGADRRSGVGGWVLAWETLTAKEAP